ncbi:type VI secretion system baseplate subunit TssF, partial [Burkholderia thailandensis]|uniref:type VI secretion system baseplate subunit TssF n=1 Tax=Burkholderia thailandensis TaxID=57975 RepID=UPI00217EDAFD
TKDISYRDGAAVGTNRALHRLSPGNGVNDLTRQDSGPIEGVRLVHPPSAPREPYATGETAWRLIRQLSFNYVPLAELDHRDGGQALRNMLRLFVGTSEREQATQIDSLVGARTAPVVRRLPGHGLLVYGRGVRCERTVDESGFSVLSPYLFGLMLEQYLTHHVSINVFT